MGPKEIAKNLEKGGIFIYPGNEGYEIACNMLCKDSVEEMLDLKIEGSFSIIAPSRVWIYKNLMANKHYVDRLPGQFTFIFKVKSNARLPKYAMQGNKSAVRMANNDLCNIASKNNMVLFTYILKKEGKLIIKPDAISRNIKNTADFMMDAGTLDVKSHVVIDLTGKVARIV